MDEAEQHQALNHHSQDIAYTAKDILDWQPDHDQAQILFRWFALSLNGLFHTGIYGEDDEEEEHSSKDHIPWKPEHLPYEDHSGLLSSDGYPEDADGNGHNYHGGEGDQETGHDQTGHWADDEDGEGNTGDDDLLDGDEGGLYSEWQDDHY
jgi:hypothetical protein